MIARSLPLGLDLGSSRIRLARARRSSAGSCLEAMAVRDVPEGLLTPISIDECDLVAAIVEDLRHELGARERRCVFSLSAQTAAVRFIRFPAMSHSELRSAARFEARRFAPARVADEDCVVRVHPVVGKNDIRAVGAARGSRLRALVNCTKRAGLRPVAADFDAFALERAFPGCDAVFDIGYKDARLHAFSSGGPMTIVIEGGGAQITRAIAADLSIDLPAAEKRKRQIGTAGAGEVAREELATAAASAVAKARERVSVARVALVGNGSRLPGLARFLEAAAGIAIEAPLSRVLHGQAYPSDVAAAAAPDWTLAASLAVWAAQ